MTRKEFHEGIVTLVKRNRIFALLPEDSNEMHFYADSNVPSPAIPQSLTVRQVKILLTQPKRTFMKM